MEKMPQASGQISGIWLPLITPFQDGMVDEPSLRQLVRYYRKAPLDGFIVAATTGEGLTLDDAETEHVARVVAAELDGSKPLYLGLCGADTRKLIARLRATEPWPIAGYLIACPYYSRPSQAGLARHFAALADATARSILVYNIPYRTGVRDAPRARGAQQYRRRQGLLRRSRPELRAPAPAAARPRRAHGRRCLLPRRARARRRWRHSRLGAYRSRGVCRGAQRISARRSPRGAPMLAGPRRCRALALWRTQSGTDQALALARRAHRFA